MEPIIIKKSIKKDLITVLLSLVFVALGCFMVSVKDDTKTLFAGWAAIIVFGFGTLLVLTIDIKTFNKPYIVINDNHLSYFTINGYKDISYSDIKYFYFMKNEVIGFYSKKPTNKLKTDLGGFPLKEMNIPTRKLISILAQKLKEHGAEEIY